MTTVRQIDTYDPILQLPSFRGELYGKNAFYLRPDYYASSAIHSDQLQPISYRWNSESQFWTLVKRIASVVIFPIGIYNLVHSLIGKLVIPATNRSYESLNSLRGQIDLNSEWKYKRLTIEVDGYLVDTMIMGKNSTLQNGRWVVHSLGNDATYEHTIIKGRESKQFLESTGANGIFFNYAGVGLSNGLPNRAAMEKAYRAVLNFLEDQTNGIGASEIIGYGHSLGGAVQADGLRSHTFKAGIKYAFVKSRTFSTLAEVIRCFNFNKFFIFLARFFGWNFDNVSASKELEYPEIILQSARVQKITILGSPDYVGGDTVIPDDATLAKNLLLESSTHRNKMLLGIPQSHNEPIRNFQELSREINAALSCQ